MSYLGGEELDEMFEEGAQLVIKERKASASLLQRRLKLGYARAARLLDQLESSGVIGPANGAIPRQFCTDTKVDLPARVKVEIKKEQPLAWKKTKYTKRDKKLEVSFGKDDKGKEVKFDFEKWGNLLVIGNQFTDKNNLLKNILVEMISGWSPDEVGLVVMDGGAGELEVPRLTPHLLVPVIWQEDKRVSALKWAVSEINRRRETMMEEKEEKLAKIVILISDLYETLTFSPGEVEESLIRISSMGREFGIYLVMVNRYLDPAMSKYLMANIGVRLVFKQMDKRTAKSSRVTESGQLEKPNEAILEMVFEKRMKIKVEKRDYGKIYREVFG